MTISHTRTKIIVAVAVAVIPITLIAQITSDTNSTTTDTVRTGEALITPSSTNTTTTSSGETANTSSAGTISPDHVRECTQRVETALDQNDDATVLTQCSTALSTEEEAIDAEQAEETRVIEQSRATWDNVRREQFAALRSRAVTDRQKQAVEDFIRITNEAVTVRKSGVNSAVAGFHGRRRSAVAERRGTVNTASTQRTARVQEIGNRARTQCAAGQNATTIQQAVAAQRESMRQELRSTYALCGTLDSALETYRAARLAERNAAIERSLSEFQAKTAAARAELRAAFGITE